MRLSYIVFELKRVISRKWPILTYPTYPMGVIRLNFDMIFGIR